MAEDTGAMWLVSTEHPREAAIPESTAAPALAIQGITVLHSLPHQGTDTRPTDTADRVLISCSKVVHAMGARVATADN